MSTSIPDEPPLVTIDDTPHPASARGAGVHVVHRWDQIPKKQPLVVQRYVRTPYLINGTKFDLRLYALVTSFDPLKIYLFPDGLVRFASNKYSQESEDLSDRYMHLTNYSINKKSATYTAGGSAGITFEGFADADKDLELCAELTDDEIIRQVTEDSDDSDTENEEPAPTQPTSSELTRALMTLSSVYSGNMTLTEIEADMIAGKRTVQKEISDFFAPKC
ncbi:hypothetical protein HPB49_026473 [Dermacentor silvarum]|nr:hypothetical protein HPB49_026473 [Dermacentor silvarum]